MASSDSSKPNIVLILTDDQGPWAMGCAGNHEIQTPNIDALAASGMRFSSFFCTSPVCSPARASLMTGRIPSQHGIHDWLKGGTNIGEDATEYLRGQLGYSDILAENGYVCGISGKWHMGDSAKPQKNFSHWYVHAKGGSPYYNAPMVRNGELVNEPDYITDVLTDDAIAFLDEQVHNKNPFYLSVHYTAPHSPWINNHPKEFVDYYNDCPFETCPQEQGNPMWKEYLIKEGIEGKERECLKGYFAAVTAMDSNVGRIIEKLGSLNLRENTLVGFLSDNGFNCGHHGIWGKGNGTFPQNMYDSSVKVPAIFNHPGRIPEGVVSDELVSGYDFMPTLLDYLDIKNPEAEKLPGRSFLPLLLGGEMPGQEHIVVYDEYGPVRMVRTREWKYVHRYPYGPHELYDIVNDPEEKNNLAEEEDKKKILQSMKAMLEDWFLKYVDPALDGTHEGVTGMGQVAFAGPAAKGSMVYSQTRGKPKADK